MPKFLFQHERVPYLLFGGQGSWLKRLRLPLAILLVFVVISTLGYWGIERNYSLLDAVYMTVITLGTVGYGEIDGPLSGAGRLWSMFVIVTGMVIVAVALSGIVAMIVEGQVRGIFGRRELQRKIANLNGHVVVCGYGRMGSLIAEKLARAGKQVVVIEADAERTAVAEQAGLLYILGDAQEEETLQAAGIERAEALITALATDAENVFVTLSAREVNRKLRIIARAEQASAEDKLKKAGATCVVCPQTIGANRMAEVVLRPAVVDFVEMAQTGDRLAVDQLEIGEKSKLVGRTLQELQLPNRIGVHVAALQRADGSQVYRPTSSVKLAAGDVLILLGPTHAAAALADFDPDAPPAAQS